MVNFFLEFEQNFFLYKNLKNLEHLQLLMLLQMELLG